MGAIWIARAVDIRSLAIPAAARKLWFLATPRSTIVWQRKICQQLAIAPIR
jgi:hypothetical protein